MSDHTINNGVLTITTERAVIDFEKQDDGTLFIEVEHKSHEYRDTCCPVVLVIDLKDAWLLAGLITGELDLMNRAQEQQIAEAANRAAILFEHEGWKWVDPTNREIPVTSAHLALMMAKQLNGLANSPDEQYTATGRLVFLNEDWSNSIRILVEVGSVDVKQAGE